VSKFIQIAVADGTLYALDGQGDVWFNRGAFSDIPLWEKVAPLKELKERSYNQDMSDEEICMNTWAQVSSDYGMGAENYEFVIAMIQELLRRGKAMSPMPKIVWGMIHVEGFGNIELAVDLNNFDN
jgi:hypothetical protein